MESNKKVRHSKNQAQVLLETDLGNINNDDELLQAFGREELCMYTTVYMHTMQAQVEGAVRICKEHRVQLLAGREDTTTMGVNDNIGIHLQHGARPSPMGMLHGSNLKTPEGAPTGQGGLYTR
eukprot:2774809-Rhodomonas_salina.2